MTLREEKVETTYLQNQPLPLALLRPLEAARYPDKLVHPVLDIGCGDGFFGRAAFGEQAFDIGADPDNEVIAKARNSGAYRLVLGFDGRRLPIKTASMNTIIANCVLEHADFPELLLKDIGRVAAPGARFHFSVPTVHFEALLLVPARGYGQFMS